MENKSNDLMIAVCGLDCGTCGIHLATNDQERAERIAKNFRENGIAPDITAEMIKCDGCKGDRSNHWHAECWFLTCCVDDKRHEFCSQCEGFPCQKLEEWATQNERYQKALDHLKNM